MYKNQLQELAQRSCFNLPSYTCLREGPDHAPRFKATVNFNGETFESPQYCSTLRQAEHSAAEIALSSLSTRHSLAARILDETGVYKNLLQEIAQRVGAKLPQYTTYRSGLGHHPVFTGTVELAGIIFTGEPAKNKKQAEKNAAMAAWSSLKQLAKESASSSLEHENTDELEQIRIARALLSYRLKERIALANSPSGSIPFTLNFPLQGPRPSSTQPPSAATSKILPLICPKSNRNRFSAPCSMSEIPVPPPQLKSVDSLVARPHKFPATGATPYVPIRTFRTTCRGIAPAVTIRTAMPVFSAPPIPQPQSLSSPLVQAGCPPPQSLSSPLVQAGMTPQAGIAPPVCLTQAVQPVLVATPATKEDDPSRVDKAPQMVTTIASAQKESSILSVISVAPLDESVPLAEEGAAHAHKYEKNQETSKAQVIEAVVQGTKELKV
ncbi:hypothetical protein SAY86_031924 [Trapa natans]|uniref:DRBM domain-containing protein n=1 Tax=Trapa natans TaxID=22666 RepID=A0AAN7M7X8_TRANT|nr:hypothetical protein SAY86_031924 [Trapa natans]